MVTAARTSRMTAEGFMRDLWRKEPEVFGVSETFQGLGDSREFGSSLCSRVTGAGGRCAGLSVVNIFNDRSWPPGLHAAEIAQEEREEHDLKVHPAEHLYSRVFSQVNLCHLACFGGVEGPTGTKLGQGEEAHGTCTRGQVDFTTYE